LVPELQKNVRKKKFTGEPGIVSEKETGKLCQICQCELVNGEVFIECPGCSYFYHEECYREYNGCGTYGCEYTDHKTKEYSVQTGVGSDFSWGDEKICPKCSRKIKISALVCRFCKSKFPTSKPMTKQEFKLLEYEGSELESARNFIFLDFFLSVFGCLFPFTLVYNAHWYLNKEGPYDFNKLPPLLKFILQACIAISTLWTVLFVSLVLLFWLK